MYLWLIFDAQSNIKLACVSLFENVHLFAACGFTRMDFPHSHNQQFILLTVYLMPVFISSQFGLDFLHCSLICPDPSGSVLFKVLAA